MPCVGAKTEYKFRNRAVAIHGDLLYFYRYGQVKLEVDDAVTVRLTTIKFKYILFQIRSVQNNNTISPNLSTKSKIFFTIFFLTNLILTS
jgi:hypothetical protein